MVRSRYTRAAVRRPRLLRRREIWVPTLCGWLLVAIFVAAVPWLLLRTVYPFLAPSQPLGRGLLVVEGWIGDRGLDTALAAWRAGGYERVATTGGPIEHGSAFEDSGFHTWAELTAHRLRARGIPAERLVAVPAPASAQDRTFLSAVVLRDWIARQGIRVSAVDVVSQGPHARRTWRLYRLAFGEGVAIGVRSAPPEGYDPRVWWRTSDGARDVVGEAIGWAWVTCCFHPGARGSLAEHWGPTGARSAARP
jgi:hypothetical protein